MAIQGSSVPGRKEKAKARRGRAKAKDLAKQLAKVKDHGEELATLVMDSSGTPIGDNGKRGRLKLAEDKARRNLMVVLVMWALQDYQLWR